MHLLLILHIHYIITNTHPPHQGEELRAVALSEAEERLQGQLEEKYREQFERRLEEERERLREREREEQQRKEALERQRQEEEVQKMEAEEQAKIDLEEKIRRWVAPSISLLVRLVTVWHACDWGQSTKWPKALWKKPTGNVHAC